MVVCVIMCLCWYLCRKPLSTSLIDSYSQSGPFGSSIYSKDFSWKPACKPECIRTGTASGQRRNNPHPSKVGTNPQNSDHIAFPLKCLPSEGEIRKALTAQYLSTYKCDFMGTPQGTQFSVNLMYENLSEWLTTSVHTHPDVITFHNISLYSSFSICHSFSFCHGIFFLTEYNDTEKAARWFAPMHNRHRISLSTDTELEQLHRILPKRG
uniref:Uncharacterized protein n=1 Tax=Maylandia zebra TaxID=106582 RepID=A0A3P9BXN2_9CICH